ncbi:MAG: riboflavin synthase [Candidatus Omnitrophica bacterium]|nr:riboflavin synthase [Candidatus Omnitrophota bacterium]
MFTGIIEEMGCVEKILRKDKSLRLEIKSEKIVSGLEIGDSVAVNGVCLTVVDIKKERLIFDCIEETLRCTNLGMLKLKEKVNLERALRWDSLLSGHIVLGHVDGMGKIAKKIKKGEEVVLYVEVDKEMLGYFIPKASITLEGVSLTLAEVGKNYFSVNLIPYTLKATTLGFKDLNDYLNIEIDILAKYVKKFLSLPQKGTLTEEFLKAHGFMR